MVPTSVNSERDRRSNLWLPLAAADSNSVSPELLRSTRVYGGAQGIWVDKKHTEHLTSDGHGVTVAILHTGRHYPDDLSDDGLIYHYPVTRRPPGRDAAEIQATKNAGQLSLPIFVILPGTDDSNKRSVRLGWVVDSDNETKQFLVLFSTEKPGYQPPPDSEQPFSLTGGAASGTTTAKTRPGQQRFRFQVLAKYGCKCAVCEIAHPSLIKAAHICGKASKGSDDWRNGLPLCSTHHDAFDANLFAINPDTRSIVAKPGLSPVTLGIGEAKLAVLHHQPHKDALDWRWARSQFVWRSTARAEGGIDPPRSSGQGRTASGTQVLPDVGPGQQKPAR